MTPHIEAKKEEIASIVLMPGDPNRVKYIKEKYLTDAVLVNSVRSNYAYTGFYNGIRITVMSSGMGMPSMGIYSYELFKFYDVDSIIRIGSCGSYKEDIKVGTVILAKEAMTLSNFSFQKDKELIDKCSSSKELNDILLSSSKEKGFNIIYDVIETTDIFYNKYESNISKSCCAVEMESFALFYIANKLKKKATSILTVSDNLITKDEMTSLEREKTFDDAITLVLDSLNK